MEEDDEEPEQGGGEAVGVHIFIQIRCTVCVDRWCQDVGGYPPYGTVTGGFPGPGGAEIDREDPMTEARWEVVVHLGGGGKIVGGV